MTLQARFTQSLRATVESYDEWRERTGKKNWGTKLTAFWESVCETTIYKHQKKPAEEFIIQSEHPIPMLEIVEIARLWLEEQGYTSKLDKSGDQFLVDTGGIPNLMLERNGKHAGILFISSLGFLYTFQMISIRLYLD